MRVEFWELIDSLAERGTTILVTTHYMDEAEHCHRLALMYRGRIIAKSSPQGLRRSMHAGEFLAVERDRPLEAMEAAERTSSSLSSPWKTKPSHEASMRSLRTIKAVSAKEARELARDPVTVFVALLAPGSDEQ